MANKNQPIILANQIGKPYMSMSDRIACAIQRAIALPGVTGFSIAEKTGISTGRISQLKNGEAGEISAKVLFALARAIGVNPNWLVEGDGPMYPSDPQSVVLIPCYEPSKAAQICEAGQGDRGVQSLNRGVLDRAGLNPEHLQALSAPDDSMSPTILVGDLLLIDISQTQIRSGNVYAIDMPGGVPFIRRMIQTVNADWIVRTDSSDKIRHPDHMLGQDIYSLKVIGRIAWRGGAI